MIDEMENFLNTKQVLYDHVGFVEDWVVYPIEDRTSMIWFIDDETVYSTETINKLLSDDYCVDLIYKQRFYEKWIYRGEKMTMVFVDTRTDGNKFFTFFDNEKELNNIEKLKKIKEFLGIGGEYDV